MPTLIPKLSRYYIYLIIIFALILRAFRISNYPTLNSDEAAIGYNAYSLLETGRDEHAISWPLHFKSFGDFKPGGYFYLALPFIKIFGLNPLAVRLPNLILSVLAIFYLFRLVKIITRNHRLSLISALLLTISPWHLHFSRGAWETSAALSFILIGTYYFIVFTKSLKINNLYLSIFAFIFSLYIYHSARIFVPLIVLSLFITQYSLLVTNFKKLIFPFLIGILLTLPVLLSFLNSGGTARFSGVGLMADPGPKLRAEELINQDSSTDLFYRITHNYRFLYLISWAEKYFSHFNFNFLFLNGDEVPRSKVPDMGQMYLIELPLLLLGLYVFFHKSYFINHKSLIISWLLLAPLASSMTFQAPSALRSLPLVIPLVILSALGLNYLFDSIHKSYFIFLKSILIFVYLFSFIYYLDAYYVHYQKRYPFAWEYGFNQIIPIIESEKNIYSNIYLTNTYDQPYIYYLFYTKYPPALLHPQIKLTPPDQFGFSTVSTIDNIHFGPIVWDKIPSNSLVIAGQETIGLSPLNTINSPNGLPLFKIYIKP